MLIKTGKFWWLIALVIASVFGILSIASAYNDADSAYIGRTTLMETSGKVSPAQIAEIARSQRVLSNVVQTLNDLGLKHGPDKILASLSVNPVKDTNIVAIEITSSDVKEAKVTANVVATEMKKEYTRLYSTKSDGQNKFRLVTIDPAYVRPVDKTNMARVILMWLAGPLSGPAIGLIIGLLLGIGLTSLFRKKRVNQI